MARLANSLTRLITDRRLALLIAGGSLAILAVGVGWALIHHTAQSGQASSASTRAINLLAGQHWQLAGAKLANGTLYIADTGLAIVRQDGSPGQPNPPVNLYGVRLQASGDFTVTATLSHIVQGASLYLYGAPPLIEDEVRAEEGTLAFSIENGNLTVALSDQRQGVHAERQVCKLNRTSTTHTLGMAVHGEQLLITADSSQACGPIASDGIFDSHAVWFGFDAPAGGSFQVRSLAAQPNNSGSIQAVDTRGEQVGESPVGLAAIAQNHRPDFMLGASVALGPMVSDPVYRKLLGNFNAVTTENVGKFQFIHPLPGNMTASYNFNDMDAVVAMARQAGMAVHGHALVFGEANPAWVQGVARTDPARLGQVMTDHIQTVVSHYRGAVEGWDVINEPLADYGTTPGQYGLRQDIWYDAMGPDYIATALRAAHEADPSATLWINEFGLETDTGRLDQMVRLLRWLQSQHVPLTGVGFQAHIDQSDTILHDSHVDQALLASHLNAIATLGLKVRISELDVSDASEYPVFTDVISVCKNIPACTGVTIWGVTDKYSSSGSLDDNGIYTPGIGLPWDDQEQALPPVSDIRRLLSS